MAALAILAVVCTTGALFLLRFLVAICGKDGRGNHVVHVLREWPERDAGNDVDFETANEGANDLQSYRGMEAAAKLTSRRHRGGNRGWIAVQKLKSRAQRISESRKSFR